MLSGISSVLNWVLLDFMPDLPAAEEYAESGEPDQASQQPSKGNGLNKFMAAKLADAVGNIAGKCCVQVKMHSPSLSVA